MISAPTKSPEFEIYAYGLCFASVCTSLADLDEITRRLNSELPTGVTPWKPSTERFRQGPPNPCPCMDKPDTHQHYLFDC